MSYTIDLTGKNALVTGGSRGIGRAITDTLFKAGASVATCGRSLRPENLNAEILWQTTDMKDAQSVKSFVGFAHQEMGSIDILVNNAGIQIEKSVVDTADEDFDELIGINCNGPFMMARATIPFMLKGNGGVIINIGSISGNLSDPGMAIYNASKAFVHGLTRSIAIDHGPKIRSNAISPGWIMTGMADAAFAAARDPDNAKKDALARHASGRFGEPQDIANTVLWLCSDLAAFVTGECITVDGGLTASSPLNPGLY